MGAAEKIKGKFKQAVGAVRERVGHAAGEHGMEERGREQKAEGAAQEAIGTAGEKIHGAGERAEGKVKETIGQVSGDRGTEAEGKIEELGGKARQKLNE